MIMLKHKGDRYLTKEKNELIDESFILLIESEEKKFTVELGVHPIHAENIR